MSWLKLGLHLTSYYAFRVSLSNPAPNAPKSDVDAIEKPTLDVTLNSLCPPTLKNLLAIPALAEVAIVLALHYPSAESTRILEFLGYSPTSLWSEPPRLALAGAALAVLGGLARKWCYRTLGKHFTFQLALRPDHKLVTDGPYAIVRHPGYTAFFASCTGMLMLHATPGSWIRNAQALEPLRLGLAVVWPSLMLMAWSMLARRLSAEDQFLRKHFGKVWDDYAARVRYWLVPGLI